MTQQPQHPFDRALVLDHSDLRAGLFTGTTSPDYWNMIGPFGGTTAAVALQAVLRHPDLLGASYFARRGTPATGRLPKGQYLYLP